MKKLLLLFLLLCPLKVDAISASAYIVMDSDVARVLEGSNMHTPYLIASTTKIMTTLVVLNNSDIHQTVLINDEVLKSYGSGIYVEIGEKITILDLLYGLMLRSGNDAAIALASEVGGSMAGFVTLMNETALALGMTKTNFLNSHGLEEKDDTGNTSSAYDMGLLSSYAIKNSLYSKIVSTEKYIVKTNFKTYLWHNKNKLLTDYEYCTGGKTGFTKLARRTLVTTASKDAINLTVVTFKDGDDFHDHQTLYEKYFKTLKKYPILKKGAFPTKYEQTFINEDFAMSLTKEEYKNIVVSINYSDNNATNMIGEVTVSLSDQVYFRTPIYQENTTTKKVSLWHKIKRIFNIND